MVDQAAADANLTIDASKPGQAALEILQNKQAGGQMTQGIYQFLKRATSPGSQPVTYPEARSFFSNLSSLSMNESQRLAPNTQRLLGNFVSALDDSIRDAVGQIGQGDNYAQAMRQYAAGAQRSKIFNGLVKKYIPAGIAIELARRGAGRAISSLSDLLTEQ